MRDWVKSLEKLEKIQGGEFTHQFLSESLVFCEKISEWVILSKKWAICSCAYFWWGTRANRSQCLSFGEQPERGNEQIAHCLKKLTKKCTKDTILFKFFKANCWFFVSERANERKKTLIRSFITSDLSKLLTVNLFVMRDLSNSLTVPLLSWATWAISSQSLICTERFERLAHSHSLKRAILSVWAMRKWANEGMSKFLTLKKGYFLHCKNYYKFWFV